MLEGFKNGKEFLVMSVVAQFSKVEGMGVEHNGVKFSIAVKTERIAVSV